MWKTLSKTDARKEFLTWEHEKAPEPDCEDKYMELRKRLIEANDLTVQYLAENESDSRKRDYLYDLKFGLEMYNILMNEYNFTPRLAANDQIWIYLSMKAVPDLVYRRWGLSESRFYKQSRRIWLKTIWWYIHLSWTDNIDKTYQILRGFTTDEIVQLVERSGPNGYRIDVTREIMFQFSQVQMNNQTRNLFRKIMKLNTARIKIVEPALTKGGTKYYVEELIKYFDESRRNY
ncbi:hypothetical protein [Ferdinandcohnia sp. Marseille-Q9671]